MWVISDLDGTLRDTRHRDHLVEVRNDGTRPDWDTFYARGKDDPPIVPVCEILSSLWAQGAYIEIWTGTPEKHREDTLLWLAHHLELPETRFASERARATSADRILRMRRNDDFRGANVFKGEFLDDYIAKWRRKPDLSIDDRANCVEWWRKCGIVCLDVAGHSY